LVYDAVELNAQTSCNKLSKARLYRSHTLFMLS